MQMPPKSIKDCINSPMPVISSSKWEQSFINRFIVDATLRFLMANSETTNEQNVIIADQFATDIMETRQDWRPDDVVYFFKFFRQRKDIPENCVIGNRITNDRLMQSVYAYEAERADERVKVYKAKYEEKETDKMPSCESAKSIVAEIKNRINAQQAQQFAKRELTDEEKLHQSIFSHFDDLFKADPVIRSGMRFVNYAGEVMSQEMFLAYNLKNLKL